MVAEKILLQLVLCHKFYKLDYIPNFLIFDPKHTLWVLVRTASPRRFLRVPTMYVLSENIKKIKVCPMSNENFQFFMLKKFSVYCMGKFS